MEKTNYDENHGAERENPGVTSVETLLLVAK